MRVSPLFLFATAWVLSRMASPAGKATLPGGTKSQGGRWTRAELVKLAWDAGFPDDEKNTAAAVALAESGGNPDALNAGPRERSVGLWQINLRAHKGYSEADMRNPTKNAAAAFAIFSVGNSWKPWGAYTNGSYKQYLLFNMQSIDTSDLSIHTADMRTSTSIHTADMPTSTTTPAAKARTASIPAKYKVKKHSGVRSRPSICITISEDDVRRLDVVARAEGTSRSRLVSALSRFAFERHFGKTTTLDAAEAEYPADMETACGLAKATS